MNTYSFENLEVWKKSRELVLCIYRIQAAFPSFEKYCLGDQLRRAVVLFLQILLKGTPDIP